MTATDDLGRLFDRVARDRGECFDFPIGIQREPAGEIVWEWFSHVAYDGIGALQHLAQRHRLALRTPRLRVRPDRPARFAEHLQPVTRWRYAHNAPRSPWHVDPTSLVGPSPRTLPQHLLLLSEDETGAVLDVARQQGVSVNSLVLWALTVALRPSAVGSDDPQYWTIPINMRGGTGIPTSAANQLSFVRAPIRPGDGPEAVHRTLNELLASGLHWVMVRGIAWFARSGSSRFPPVRSTGTLSNPGAYTGSPDLHRIVFSPPCGTTEPVSAGVVTWNGRMSLTLTVHRSLRPPPDALTAVAARWRVALCTGREP